MRYIELLNKYLPLAKLKGLEEEAVKLIISEIAGYYQTEIYLHYNDVIPHKLEKKMVSGIEKYLTGYPAQYILGYTYFYGTKILVNENVLIPRFDTEVVVDFALKVAKAYHNPHILDVCCGSGAIAIAMAKEGYHVDGLDISKKALKVANENALLNNVKIHFFESDLLRNVKEKYDILVTNPPYIAKGEYVDKMVLDNEPHLALFSDNDGLEHYHNILKDASRVLNPGGTIVFEIAYNKAEVLKNLVLMYFKNVHVEKDFAGNDRVMIIN